MYHGNLKLSKTDEDFEVFLYIGDGRFHPKALLFEEEDSEQNREVISFNPISKQFNIYGKKDIEKVINKRKANMKKFLISDKIGIIVTIKPGQEHTHYIEKLEKKFPKKDFYLFITDNISFSDMENFPFIKCWINTACPRIGMEDSLEFEKFILNAEEALKLSKF